MPSGLRTTRAAEREATAFCSLATRSATVDVAGEVGVAVAPWTDLSGFPFAMRSAEAAHLRFGAAAPGYETEPRVYRDRTERSRYEGIEVHLSELRDGVGHPGNTQQNILDGCDVAQRRTPMSEEERCAANRTHHLMRVPIGEWQNPEHTVGKQFDSSAAAAKHHDRPEEWVRNHARDELDAADHRLHDGTLHQVTEARRHCHESGFHLFSIGEIESDRADIRLVNDAITKRLEGDCAS